ncbi:MAG TPA: ShlB/FhaC/HecB family hemolysin secretion/activation protein [Planctomicrobium sp.]|nr:ShlB/FhaC/HecB family hemolysin secretion/activation protein [Planctomicrobium sp.]
MTFGDRIKSTYRLMLAMGAMAGAAVGTVAKAQDFERYRPQPLPVAPPSSPQLDAPLPPVSGSEKELLSKLETIIVVDHIDKVDPDGVRSEETGLLYNFANTRSLVFSPQFQEIASRHLNQPATLRSLNQLSRDIILLYRANGQPVLDVLIPEQKVTGGAVQIIVIEGKIGHVRVEEGRFFSADQTARWIDSTYSGNAIYEPWLEDDLFWLNQNPFRRVGVDLQPGTGEGLTDVLFTVEDVFPVRAYVGYDDTGVRALGLERLSAGFTAGNVFGREGLASYQYTTDSDFRRLHAHAATYERPINRDWRFQTYGSWAGVMPTIGGGFNQEGESWITGFGLVRVLEKNRYVDENVRVGFDFKSTNNNLEFGGENVFGSRADLTSINVGYAYLERDDFDQYLIVNADTWIGPGSGFTDHNNAASFSTIRPDTAPEFIYARLRYERAKNIGENWQLVFRGIGQVSSDRLLYSEMLGFGGFDSIRGYDQRTANGDHGWQASFELGPRPIHLDFRGEEGRLRVYGFMDSGEAFIMNPQPGEVGDQFMISTGFGMRLNVGPSLAFRFDYAYNFKEVPGEDINQRVHIGLIWQFGPLPR